jgi:hypothetical protein
VSLTGFVQSKNMVKFSRRFCVLAALAVMSAAFAFAGSPEGDWKGSFDFNGTDVPLTFHLKAKEANLTGSIEYRIEGGPTAPLDIKHGKIEGNTITFTAVTDYQGNPVTLVYKGTLDGDQIKFSMGTDDGSWGVEFVAKRSAN